MVVEGTQAIALEWTFFGLAGVFVFIRLYIRCFHLHNMTKSDWIIFASYLTFGSTAVIDSMSSAEGFFARNVTYDSDLSQVIPNPKALVKVLKLCFVSAFPYLFTLYGVKLSFLFLYYSLIPKTLPKLRIFLHVTSFLVACGFIISINMNLFWCLPVRNNWSTDKNTQCLAYATYTPYFVTTGFHIITDILIYALPFPLLKSLQLGRRQFFGVVSIFAAGGLCILATVARTAAIGVEANTAQVGVFTAMEQSTALIVASMPALKAFVVARSRNGSKNSARRQYSTPVQKRMSGAVLHMTSKTDVGHVGTSRSGREVSEGSWIRLESPSPTRTGTLQTSDTGYGRGDESTVLRVQKNLQSDQTTQNIHHPDSKSQDYDMELFQDTATPIQLKLQRDEGNKLGTVRIHQR